MLNVECAKGQRVLCHVAGTWRTSAEVTSGWRAGVGDVDAAGGGGMRRARGGRMA